MASRAAVGAATTTVILVICGRVGIRRATSRISRRAAREAAERQSLGVMSGAVLVAVVVWTIVLSGGAIQCGVPAMPSPFDAFAPLLAAGGSAGKVAGASVIVSVFAPVVEPMTSIPRAAPKPEPIRSDGAAQRQLRRDVQSQDASGCSIPGQRSEPRTQGRGRVLRHANYLKRLYALWRNARCSTRLRSCSCSIIRADSCAREA